jgi:hypothetical protein
LSIVTSSPEVGTVSVSQLVAVSHFPSPPPPSQVMEAAYDLLTKKILLNKVILKAKTRQLIMGLLKNVELASPSFIFNNIYN